MINVGDDFYGFQVVRSEDNALGHIWVFQRMGKHVQLEMKKEDYFSLILDEYAKRDILDAMQKHLYQEFGGSAGKLDGFWGGV